MNFVSLVVFLGCIKSCFCILIDGRPANKSLYNWFVNIWPDNSRPREEFIVCGGGVINKNSVITAASCVRQYIDNPNQLIITAQFRLKDIPSIPPDPNDPRQPPLRATQILIHPDYRGIQANLYPADLAIIKVSPNFTFNYFAGPLPEIPDILKDGDYFSIPSRATICGVGARQGEDVWIYHNIVRCRNTVRITLDECARTGGYNRGHLDDRYFCTRPGACKSDRGGPALGSDFNLRGIISTAGLKNGVEWQSCRDFNPPRPVVYTNLSHYDYRFWVMSNTNR